MEYKVGWYWGEGRMKFRCFIIEYFYFRVLLLYLVLLEMSGIGF